jgi:hypothetical protein
MTEKPARARAFCFLAYNPRWSAFIFVPPKEPMNWQRTLPVLTSIALILVVAVLRDRSRTLAAILATMPINIPLALWVISSGSDNDPQVLSDTIRTMFIGLIPGFVWLGIVLWLTRLGWTIFPAMGVGYVAWALLIGGMFALGILTWPKA